MNKFLLFFLLALVPGLLEAQSEKRIKWGKVSPVETALKYCDYDSSATAVVLSDIASMNFYYGSDLLLKRHCRIKILKSAGTEFANIEIPFYSKNYIEKISSLKAQTLNIDEKGELTVHELKSSDFYKSEVSENTSMVRFTLPAVKAGSIIEYKYDLVSKDFLSLFEWEFQTDIPTLYSCFNAKVQEGLDVKIYYASPGLVKKYDETKTNRWELNNLPAITEEPFCPNPMDYRERIRFQLAGYYAVNSNKLLGGFGYENIMTSWEELSQKLYEDGNLNALTTGNSEADAIIQNTIHTDFDPDKASSLYNYVIRNLKWNNTYAISSKKTFAEIIREGSGNAAEINLVLCKLLQKARLNASPMLISTKTHGLVTKVYPLLNQFNKLVVSLTINNKSYLIDATNPAYTMMLPPLEDLPGHGFVLDRKKPVWQENKFETSSSSIRFDAVYQLTPTDTLKTELKYIFKGYPAVEYRKMLAETSDFKVWVAQHFIAYEPGAKIDSISIKNKDDLNNPLELKFYVSTPLDERITDSLLLFTPSFPEKFGKNLFDAPGRLLPVDLEYPVQINSNIILKHNNRFIVDNKPAKLNIATPGNQVQYTYSSADYSGMVVISANLQVNSSLISNSEYPNLKKFFSEVEAKQKESVILKYKRTNSN